MLNYSVEKVASHFALPARLILSFSSLGCIDYDRQLLLSLVTLVMIRHARCLYFPTRASSFEPHCSSNNSRWRHHPACRWPCLPRSAAGTAVRRACHDSLASSFPRIGCSPRPPFSPWVGRDSPFASTSRRAGIRCRPRPFPGSAAIRQPRHCNGLAAIRHRPHPRPKPKTIRRWP